MNDNIESPADQPSRPTDTVRIEKDLAHKLSIVATRRNMPVSNLLSPHIREWVEELYRQTVREMHREIE